MSEEERPKAPILPGIVMLLAGVFLAVSAVIQAEEYSGKVYLKIGAGVIMAAYGLFRIVRR